PAQGGREQEDAHRQAEHAADDAQKEAAAQAGAEQGPAGAADLIDLAGRRLALAEGTAEADVVLVVVAPPGAAAVAVVIVVLVAARPPPRAGLDHVALGNDEGGRRGRGGGGRDLQALPAFRARGLAAGRRFGDFEERRTVRAGKAD